MFKHFQYALLLAKRSRYAHTVLALSILLIAFAMAASAFSGRQPQTATLDLGISFIRWTVALLAVLLAQELVGKDIERRTVYMYLTYPTDRSAYLIGRFAGIAALLAIVLTVLSVLLAAVVANAGGDYVQSSPVNLGTKYLVNQSMIWLDTLVILSIALFLCTISTTPNLVFIIGCAAIVATRSLGGIIEVLQKNQQFDHAYAFQTGLSHARFLLPDLSLLDTRMIALYDSWQFLNAPILLLVMMPLAYSLAMITLAAIVFQRREFQ